MTYCGMDCCKDCSKAAQCGGCEKCNGHPFGGNCIAERNNNFAELGYKLQEYTAVDLFPRTSHVETVVLLSKMNTSK